MISLTALRREAGIGSLLSALDTNPKTAKGSKKGYRTAVLHLAPARVSGFEVCPKRSAGCTAACLHEAGNPIHLVNKTRARIARTHLLFKQRDLFFNVLAMELDKHISDAKKADMEPVMRLNATSDLRFEALRFKLRDDVAEKIGRKGNNIIDMFKNECRAYDYTAILNRRVPDDYHITFSLKEDNEAEARAAIDKGWNIAAVFFKDLPETFMGLPVINGDEDDLRFLDPTPCVVGLKAKGPRGKADTSGFVLTA